jgi:hypothetical protein
MVKENGNYADLYYCNVYHNCHGGFDTVQYCANGLVQFKFSFSFISLGKKLRKPPMSDPILEKSQAFYTIICDYTICGKITHESLSFNAECLKYEFQI